MIRICAGAPQAWLKRYRGKKPLFACVLSYTHTGTIADISAAGITPASRKYTALADGAFWLEGAGLSASNSTTPAHLLPPLQAGVSPALISRAIASRQQIPCCLLSTGLPGHMSAAHVALPQVIAASLETGRAMTALQVHQLWQSGLVWGHRLARAYAGRYLVLGECVVGGTTTAQGLLTALGYEVAGQMSSSHLGGNHDQKQLLVSQGLSVWRSQGNLSAAAAVAAVGDPMLVVAAAIAISASRTIGVMLAGGSQMLAVYALIKAVCKAVKSEVTPQIVVGTTRWVIEDETADTVAIAQAIGAPYLASELSFSQSPYAELKAYEAGYIKEGMGAGGCAIAANLYEGWGRSQIRKAVEAELLAYRISQGRPRSAY